jgi:hypothetical protein
MPTLPHARRLKRAIEDLACRAAMRDASDSCAQRNEGVDTLKSCLGARKALSRGSNVSVVEGHAPG